MTEKPHKCDSVGNKPQQLKEMTRGEHSEISQHHRFLRLTFVCPFSKREVQKVEGDDGCQTVVSGDEDESVNKLLTDLFSRNTTQAASTITTPVTTTVWPERRITTKNEKKSIAAV